MDSAAASGSAVGFGDGYISEVTAWTFMPNLWIDVPLHQPIAWMFGRIPMLEPLTLDGGVKFFSIPYPEKWAIRRDAP